MTRMMNRRMFLATAGTAVTAVLTSCATTEGPLAKAAAQPAKPHPPNGAMQLYVALPEERFPVPAVDLTDLGPEFYRRRVDYTTPEAPGTVIVDTQTRYLFHVEEGGTATRYGVGIGQAGFAWAGRAHIAYGREWPTWTPPREMIERHPGLEKWKSGQPPGINNALGARALYIHQGNRDTLYRLHGTGEARTIGRAVSSGCVRLLHPDIIHLY